MTRWFLGFVLALGLAVTAAPASADSTRSYAVDITGIQVTDWQYRSHVPLPEVFGWTTGDGSETIGFSTRRTGTLTAFGRQLFGMSREPKIKGTVTRESAVTHKAGPPVCEGGTLDPECAAYDPAAQAVPQSCGRKPLAVQTHVTSLGQRGTGLVIALETSTKDLYRECGPDEGERSTFTGPLDEHEVISFPNSAGRIARLKRGRTLKLHKEVRSAGCPLPTRVGYAACVTIDVTLELTRTT